MSQTAQRPSPAPQPQAPSEALHTVLQGLCASRQAVALQLRGTVMLHALHASLTHLLRCCGLAPMPRAGVHGGVPGSAGCCCLSHYRGRDSPDVKHWLPSGWQGLVPAVALVSQLCIMLNALGLRLARPLQHWRGSAGLCVLLPAPCTWAVGLQARHNPGISLRDLRTCAQPS